MRHDSRGIEARPEDLRCNVALGSILGLGVGYFIVINMRTLRV